ncbi:MAG: flagellar hook-basal body complex protein FliE [Defluviitaleaceae bacterium]|nr:flagellar hook-basal body complex protein FliE [Defluviitaleaceae bacterium]
MSIVTSIIDTQTQAAQIQPFSDQLRQIIQPENESSSPFAAFFDAAMGMVSDTNAMQLNAQQMQFDFATGRLDDILAVQMAMDRASNAMTFTTQVTNRVIEAYREIMRMQI